MRLCIAHGGDIGEPSGGTDRVSAIAAGLSAQGIDVSLVVPTPSNPPPDRLGPVDCIYVDAPDSSVARAAMIARTAARRARADDAMLQLEHSTLAGVGSLLGVDGYVLDMHDLGHSRFDHVDTPFAPVLKRGVKRLERRAISEADHVVAVSDLMVDQIRQFADVPPNSVSVVPNGYFPETVDRFRDISNVSGRVVFLGTLHPKVDVDTLVAIARLPAVSEMVVVGDGARHERLEQAAASSDSLRTTGRLPDDAAFELVASAEAVVNPQTVSAIQRSSSPVKLYYYAALGKPMIVTPGPSIVTELVRQSAAVTARSRRHFVKRVESVLDDTSLAGRLSENAQQAAETFAWSDRISSFESLYRSHREVQK